MDGSLQIADSLSVDDADLQNAALPAFVQITRDKPANFSRVERVQVQHAVDRKRYWRWTERLIRHFMRGVELSVGRYWRG